MPNVITKELLMKARPQAAFKTGVDLTDHVRVTPQGVVSVAEFIGAGDFAAAFYERQRYEVDAGRDEEPQLFNTIYSPVHDGNLPETININTLGPGGFIFEQVTEGGEVKFATVGEGQKTITLYQYALGLEYTKKLFMFNQTWAFAPRERWIGTAYNALLNHIHFSPILTQTYGAANKTAASAKGSTLAEKTLNTLADAIIHSVTDTTNPRRGPYDLLISTSDMFLLEAGLKRRLQDGIDDKLSAANKIQNIVAYDGWSGSRGKKTVSYEGVTPGKAYLVSKQYRDTDFQSYFKQDLQSQTGDGDISRFIVEQVVYDAWFGIYANPVRAVEEITWPTA